MLFRSDGKTVTGMEVRNNTVSGGAKALLVRLGQEQARPAMSLTGNHYSQNGILKADGVAGKLSGSNSQYVPDFSGEQLTLSSADKLTVWQRVLGVDQGTGLLE